MSSKRPLHLVIPQDQEWPVMGQESDGTLILHDGFIEDVETLNGLDAGSLSDSQLLTLLLAWYHERRRIGFPEDPVMDEMERAHSAA